SDLGLRPQNDVPAVHRNAHILHVPATNKLLGKCIGHGYFAQFEVIGWEYECLREAPRGCARKWKHKRAVRLVNLFAKVLHVYRITCVIYAHLPYAWHKHAAVRQGVWRI